MNDFIFGSASAVWSRTCQRVNYPEGSPSKQRRSALRYSLDPLPLVIVRGASNRKEVHQNKMKTSEICAGGLFPVLVLVIAVTTSCFVFRPKPVVVHPYIGRDLQALFKIAARPENQPKQVMPFTMPPPTVFICNTNPVTFVASGNSNNFTTYRKVLFNPR